LGGAGFAATTGPESKTFLRRFFQKAVPFLSSFALLKTPHPESRMRRQNPDLGTV
jgi:hypothetical protein